MHKKNITLQVNVNTADLAFTLANVLPYDELQRFIVDVDKLAADWGLTKKLYGYFYSEMRKMHEEEGTPFPKLMPAQWSNAEIFRLWNNSPELKKDVKSLAAFQRVVKAVEQAHGIREE